MVSTVLASDGLTDGQVEDLTNKFRDAVRKHRSEIPKDIGQQVLRADNIGMELFAVIRKRAEALTGIIVRRVKVDRLRASQATLDATGRKQYTDRKVVDAMPRGEGDEVEVHFFKLDRYISDPDLDKEFELRGLDPADPYSQAAVNEADPAFADEHPNGTHWKDAAGKCCCATFGRWVDGRRVSVYRSGGGWDGSWWFAGVRKKNLAA